MASRRSRASGNAIQCGGFTIIELLVVVAIIGLLSSVVLSSVRTARLKAADATVLQQAAQLRNVMEQERTNSGAYTPVKNGGSWKPANTVCSAVLFSGQFAAKAADICTKLVQAASTGTTVTSGAATASGCGSNCVFFQSVSPVNSPEQYSIMAFLPYESLKAAQNGCTANCGRYLCLGSSGGITIGSDGASWDEPGCQAKP